MKSKFQIGDKVKAVSFTDCFGNFIPERNNLTVTKVCLIESTSLVAPYFRIEAHESNGFGYVEGAERFFDVA